MSRTPGIFHYRFFIEDSYLHEKGEPWNIKDRHDENKTVEMCPTREIARQRVALLNGRVRLVAEEGTDTATRIKAIGRL